MANEEKNAVGTVRVIIRIELPETTPDTAVTLHTKLAEMLRDKKDAQLEVNMLPVLRFP